MTEDERVKLARELSREVARCEGTIATLEVCEACEAKITRVLSLLDF